MYPILWSWGPLTLYTYGVLLALAFAVTTWLARRDAKALPPGRRALNADQIQDFASAALLGGILGGRLLYVIVQWPAFAAAPALIPAIWRGGLIWYGGFAGGLLAGWIYLRAQGLPVLRALDQFIPFLAVGHAIGRIGCFFNGCCYGRSTEAWYGVQFPGHPRPVVPTQLFEAAGLVAMFFALRAARSTCHEPGRVFGLYLTCYAALRFGIEFFRGDQARWHGLTLPQAVSIALLAIGYQLVKQKQETVSGTKSVRH